MEEWRDIPGFPGYQVSNFGRVRSLDRIYERGGRSIFLKGRIRKLGRVFNEGRLNCLNVTLHKNKKGISRQVHRLVLEAFVGPQPTGMECCHNDGNSTNNKLTNLRWDTRAANQADSKRHGTKRDPPRYIGTKHPQSKLTEDDIKEIRSTDWQKIMLKDVAKKLGVTSTTVATIRDGRGWPHVK